MNTDSNTKHAEQNEDLELKQVEELLSDQDLRTIPLNNSSSGFVNSSNDALARQYNFIYKQLVDSDNDLVGLVAYGIYKQHKIEFLQNFKEDVQREPTDGECKVFYLTTTTKDQLRKYRDQAETLVSGIVMNSSMEEISAFEDDMLRSYESKIENVVKRNVPSNTLTFLYGLGGSVVGSLIFAIVAAAFYFIGMTTDRSTHKLVERVLEIGAKGE